MEKGGLDAAGPEHAAPGEGEALSARRGEPARRKRLHRIFRCDNRDSGSAGLIEVKASKVNRGKDGHFAARRDSGLRRYRFGPMMFFGTCSSPRGEYNE